MVAAGWADQPSGWVRLKPALAFSPIPDAVLGTKHPSPALAVEDGQVAHSEPERARLETPGTPLLHQASVTELSIRERIDCHGESIA